MVSTFPIIYKFTIPFTSYLGVVPSELISFDITIIFMFHSFLVL